MGFRMMMNAAKVNSGCGHDDVVELTRAGCVHDERRKGY